MPTLACSHQQLLSGHEGSSHSDGTRTAGHVPPIVFPADVAPPLVMGRHLAMTNAYDWRVHVTTEDTRDAHERLKRAEAAGGPPERIDELETDYDRVLRTWLRQSAAEERAKDRV